MKELEEDYVRSRAERGRICVFDACLFLKINTSRCRGWTRLARCQPESPASR